MGISVFPLPSAASKTMKREMLTSGTTYTVPAGVTYLNVTLVGAGGGAGGNRTDVNYSSGSAPGGQGESISSIVTGFGATIAYTIGAGGAGGTDRAGGSAGGSTTFTGATTAAGGIGGSTSSTVANNTGAAGQVSFVDNGGKSAVYNNSGGGNAIGGAGGNGFIVVEYWV